MQPKVFPVEQGTTQGIMNNLRQNGKESSEALIDVEMEETNRAEGQKGVTKNQCEVRMEQTLLEKHASISQTETAASRRTTSNTQEQQLHEDGTDTANDFRPVKQMRRSGEQESVVENPDEVTSGSKVNKSRPMASSSLVPQWTDEQLEELFAFD